MAITVSLLNMKGGVGKTTLAVNLAWHLFHRREGGDSAFDGKAEAVRQFAHRPYTLCERLGQSEDARAYSELITSWTGSKSAAATAPKPTVQELPGFER